MSWKPVPGRSRLSSITLGLIVVAAFFLAALVIPFLLMPA
jgi:hypothetical protein